MRRFLLLLALGGGVVCAHGPLHEQILILSAELEAQPDDPDRLARRGDLYLIHGLVAEARADWERLAGLSPNDITNEFRLGQVALELGGTNEAVRRLERFVTARPDSPTGHRVLARALRMSGRPREAAAQVAAAIAGIADAPPEAWLEQARDLVAAQAP
ncbi:MAG: tetratricopeptide repeat protein, partial [Verrucomicrobia bacterium]|nr:tetratricopeptide repeat protein [Verrucomicrobiota bacterium]